MVWRYARPDGILRKLFEIMHRFRNTGMQDAFGSRNETPIQFPSSDRNDSNRSSPSSTPHVVVTAAIESPSVSPSVSGCGKAHFLTDVTDLYVLDDR
jgi:hypothetical protein